MKSPLLLTSLSRNLRLLLFVAVSMAAFGLGVQGTVNDSPTGYIGPFNSSISELQFLSNPGMTSSPGVTVTQFAGGMSFPRGLKFGPGGSLYVAEAGPGGDATTVGLCTQVPAPIGPWLAGNNGRVSRLDRNGIRTTVADGFPSTFSVNGGELGVEDISFLDGRLYALVAGGGCSHGHINPTEVNGVYRINNNGSWNLVADISKFVKNHETAHPEPDDFEPDGTPYSMVAIDDSLYVVEPNHGQVLKIERNGHITRLADISEKYGHIVPTAMTDHDGSLFVGNLGLFPITVGSSQITRVGLGGHMKTAFTGLTAVLGVAFDEYDNLYALEMSTVDQNFPVPGTGRVVRINRRTGALTEVVSGLSLPTAMAFGRDGELYISNWGFGPPLGEILKVTFNDHCRFE
ncbi:MAG: ScyD/ScyE family protein [Pyrinomonadaceae bacterium]